jgi:hypothetical protein
MARRVCCPHCNSDQIKRRIGRPLRPPGRKPPDNLTDPANLAGLEDDPKALAPMMRQMAFESERSAKSSMRSWTPGIRQSPEDIEQAMPDLGSETSGAGIDDFD